MARPEEPLTGKGPLVDFAQRLRELRHRTGLSYRQMALRGSSYAMLMAAASGRDIPTVKVLAVFVDVCGGDVDDWLKERQRLVEAKRRGETIRIVWPPELRDFLQAIHDLRKLSGVSLEKIALACDEVRASRLR